MADVATQNFLEIDDIREGVLLLKNNSIRGILMVSSINFALKSEEEQTAIIYAFQSFLNSLDFSCQIVVQSRNINITPYLDSLRDLEEKQTNELLRKQTAAYREFIKNMVVGDVVMTKNFYVVVPYTLVEIFGAAAATKNLNIFKGADAHMEKMTDDQFQRCKTQLWQRMEYLAMGLRRCGLEAVPLTTPELIELFWAIHHPDQAEVGYYPEILPELLK
ncbi:MAG TPA: TraC family protein [Candidatus Staskawiczbacteria bacterium]|nr:TraC family protein [Candidatus Staskawiczbacteria bacterium]